MKKWEEMTRLEKFQLSIYSVHSSRSPGLRLWSNYTLYLQQFVSQSVSLCVEKAFPPCACSRLAVTDLRSALILSTMLTHTTRVRSEFLLAWFCLCVCVCVCFSTASLKLHSSMAVHKRKMMWNRRGGVTSTFSSSIHDLKKILFREENKAERNDRNIIEPLCKCRSLNIFLKAEWNLK